MDVAAAREALAASLPDLDTRDLRPLGLGWAYWTFECPTRDPESWVFRFPRTRGVARSLEREARLLPALAVGLSVAVPRFTHWDRWHDLPFAGYRKLVGQPLPLGSPSHPSRVAAEIARFLSELHGFPAPRAAELLGDANDVEAVQRGRQRLAAFTRDKVAPLLRGTTAQGLLTALAGPLRLPADFAPALVHGDLGPEHLLFDASGRELVAVIDFEDATVGDPAGDFAALQIGFGAEFTRSVLTQYTGRSDPDLLARADLNARIAPIHEVEYGLELRLPHHVRNGVAQLERIWS